MIKFQGQSSLKLYMPAKPIKRGIKVWILADAVTGYFTKFDVYTGKKNNGQVDKGLATRVVKELTAGLAGKNHHVFFEPKLLYKLLLYLHVQFSVYRSEILNRRRTW